MPLRARALEEDCPAATSTAVPCLHVIIVNVLADTPVSFTVEVLSPKTAAAISQLQASGAAGHSGSVHNATRLFDDGYNVTLGKSSVTCAMEAKRPYTYSTEFLKTSVELQSIGKASSHEMIVWVRAYRIQW